MCQFFSALVVRNGDVLLRIGNLDVTKWRTDPTVLPLSRFWEQPAGTRLDLTLRRGEQVLKINVPLRDILSPRTTKIKPVLRAINPVPSHPEPR